MFYLDFCWISEVILVVPNLFDEFRVNLLKPLPSGFFKIQQHKNMSDMWGISIAMVEGDNTRRDSNKQLVSNVGTSIETDQIGLSKLFSDANQSQSIGDFLK